MKKMPAKLFLALICWLILSSSALAHKVFISAWVEGDTVFTESGFGGGKAAKGAKVTVLDADGALLLEGKTDDEGAFSFPAPKIADLTIVLDAGVGHQATWTVSAAELAGSDAGPADGVSTTPAEETASDAAVSATPGLSAREVEEIVARQLDEKLRPLNRMMAESRDRGPTLSDILGGIGYILGLVGLSAYIRFRKGRGKP